MVNNIELLIPFMTGFGGTEKVIHNLIQANKNDKSINIYITQYGGTDDKYWVADSNYLSVKMHNNKKVRTLQYAILLPFWIMKKIKSTSSEVIISTNPMIWALSYFWKKFFHKDITVVSWYHYSLKKKKIPSMLLKMADKYLAISTGVRDELETAGVPRNLIFLVFNPIEPAENIITRSKKITNFIYVGRVMLHGQKNLCEMFTALENIKGKAEWKLQIYGDGVPEEVSEAKKFVVDKGLNNKIIFNGFKDSVWDSINNVDALILTSTYEGFGMVLAEALSHGVYAISSDCETGPKDIIDGMNGRIYRLGEVDELTAILQNIVDKKEILPSQDILTQSVEKFSEKKYYDRFLQALNM